MALKGSFEKKTFIFRRPSGTSRGILTEKHAWFISVWDEEAPETIGIGECSIIEGLSPEFKDEVSYTAKIEEVLANLTHFSKRIDELEQFPSIYFGLEMALLDLKNGGQRLFFPGDFTEGNQQIPINGLIWMGDKKFMQEQIKEKIRLGFSCIKIKIGALDFNTELSLLEEIRENFDADKITLRVDANGAFSTEEVLNKLAMLHSFGLHSIEQPIQAGQWEEMRDICKMSELPIALDEELIGIYEEKTKIKLLDMIQPKYIILKPSLMGGFKGTAEWIKLAEEREIGWWITSALESNIGLDAIAQFTALYDIQTPQGLGTGSLYENNIDSLLRISAGYLYRKEYQLGNEKF